MYRTAVSEILIGPNPQDLTAGKIFKIGAKAYEYVLYFYPAGSRLNALSITMHIDKREATPEELKVLKELVASIQWVADKVKLKKRK